MEPTDCDPEHCGAETCLAECGCACPECRATVKFMAECGNDGPDKDKCPNVKEVPGICDGLPVFCRGCTESVNRHTQIMSESRDEARKELKAALLQIGELKAEVESKSFLYNDAKNARDKHWNSLQEQLRLISELREIVDLAVDLGGVSFHEESCPQDDTCFCVDVKRVNDAMGLDFQSKRDPNSIKLPTIENRKDEDPRKGCVDFGHKGPFISLSEDGGMLSRCENCKERVG